MFTSVLLSLRTNPTQFILQSAEPRKGEPLKGKGKATRRPPQNYPPHSPVKNEQGVFTLAGYSFNPTGISLG